VLLVLPATQAAYVDSATVCVALLVIYTVGLASVTANYLAALQDISHASVGLATGVVGAFGQLVAARAYPEIGRYVDRTHNYDLIFVLLGIVPLLGLAALLALDAIVARRQRKEASSMPVDECLSS
jgi:ACS family hexuronate transporter-like MFS transporter